MAHCLRIFFLVLITHFQKCVSQLQDLQNPILSTTEVDKTSNINSGEDGTFNKSVFAIPITGVLLVISMVVLYLFYTWNLTRQDGESKNTQFDTDFSPTMPNGSVNCGCGCEFQSGEIDISPSHFPKSENKDDQPPSYFEAVQFNSGSNSSLPSYAIAKCSRK